MRTSVKGLEYPNVYYWDKNRNLYADIKNGLADCTCFVYGAIIEDGHRPVVSEMRNANTFHQSLINGWTRIPYDENKLEVGDIVQWVTHCHVAVVSDKAKNISGSFYTGIHGRSWWNGEFDKRYFKTLQEMSDWMIANYPDRFFHHWSIDNESSWVGGHPEYIIKHPLYSVPENRNIDQIHVLTNDMNVRNNDNEILKLAEAGYYNVIGWKDANGYRWYEVEKGKYIAGVESRVVYIPGSETDITKLQKENAELKAEVKLLKERLDAIRELTNY